MSDTEEFDEFLDVDAFLTLTDEHFTPIFTEWGFSEAPLINGVSYYFRRFVRNGWAIGILYERGGYTDLRFASSLELVPFSATIPVLAKRLGLSIDYYLNVITTTPIDIHYEYLMREILPKVKDYVIKVSAKPRDSTHPRATPHPNPPPQGGRGRLN